MTKLTAALALVALLSAPAAMAGDHTATTWEEALALSKAHDLPVLIDFFTEW
jgi:hypothetical protein